MSVPGTPETAAVWRAEVVRARLFAAALRRAGQGIVADVARAAGAVERLAGPALAGAAEPTALLAALLDRPAPADAPVGDSRGGRVPRAGAVPSRPLRVVDTDGVSPAARAGGPSPTAPATRLRDAGSGAPSGSSETEPAAPVAASPGTAPTLAALSRPATSLAERRSAARIAARMAAGPAAGSAACDAPTDALRAAALAMARAVQPGATVADAFGLGDRHQRGGVAGAGTGGVDDDPAEAWEAMRASVLPGLAAQPDDLDAADASTTTGGATTGPAGAVPAGRATAATAASETAEAARPAAARPHGAQAEAQARGPLLIPALPTTRVEVDGPAASPAGTPRLKLAEDDPLVGLAHRHGVDPSWP